MFQSRVRSRFALFVLSAIGFVCLIALTLVNAPVPARVTAAQVTPTPLPLPPQQPSAINHHDLEKLADSQAPLALDALSDVPCVNGKAAQYQCSNVDLAAFLPLAEMGGGNASSSWGWTDPDTGKDYALVGKTNGTAFVELSDPAHPRYLGDLPTATGLSAWRELKTYGYYAFVVSDANGNHGMQIFDLRRLRGVTKPPVTFRENAHYAGFGSAHTITLNPASGFAYVNGSNTCNGGPHFVDVRDPLHPKYAGCFADAGYTHDSQCVTYHGPDAAFSGHELCLNANQSTLNILDVTDKTKPTQLARTGYADYGYIHQGWLTEDHAYFVLDDEFDETEYAHTAYTYIWDVRDLVHPQLLGTYKARFRAIDHNQYIKGNRIYQANYRAGLHILDSSEIANGQLREVGFFDIYPRDNQPSFNGAWNVYPFYRNGMVTISGIEEGLFVVMPRAEAELPACAQKPGISRALSPANGAVVSQARVRLSWSAVACASTYKVVVREGNKKGAVVLQAKGLKAESYRTSKLTSGKQYAWRVTACNEWGCAAGPWQMFREE